MNVHRDRPLLFGYDRLPVLFPGRDGVDAAEARASTATDPATQARDANAATPSNAPETAGGVCPGTTRASRRRNPQVRLPPKATNNENARDVGERFDRPEGGVTPSAELALFSIWDISSGSGVRTVDAERISSLTTNSLRSSL